MGEVVPSKVVIKYRENEKHKEYVPTIASSLREYFNWGVEVEIQKHLPSEDREDIWRQVNQELYYRLPNGTLYISDSTSRIWYGRKDPRKSDWKTINQLNLDDFYGEIENPAWFKKTDRQNLELLDNQDLSPLIENSITRLATDIANTVNSFGSINRTLFISRYIGHHNAYLGVGNRDGQKDQEYGDWLAREFSKKSNSRIWVSHKITDMRKWLSPQASAYIKSLDVEWTCVVKDPHIVFGNYKFQNAVVVDIDTGLVWRDGMTQSNMKRRKDIENWLVKKKTKEEITQIFLSKIQSTLQKN